MTVVSKNIVLKHYIPTGTPSKNDFSVREIKLNLSNNNQILVKNLWTSSTHIVADN